MRFVWFLMVAAVLLVACSGGDVATTNVAPTSAASSTSGVPSSTEPPSVTTATSEPERTTTFTTSDPEPTTTTTTEAAPELPPQLRGQVEVAVVTLDGEVWTVAVADTPALRSQGLMNVTDLLDLDGMVFVWPDEVEGSFWMKDTLIPLDIAFFAGDGAVVGVLTMEPCRTDPCETYGVGVPFRYALETREGALAALGDGAVLSFD